MDESQMFFSFSFELLCEVSEMIDTPYMYENGFHL